MVDSISRNERLEISRVRQFGLYPLWTIGNLRGVVSSKKLLLCVVMRNDNVANNGETFICYWFKNCLRAGSLVVQFA